MTDLKEQLDNLTAQAFAGVDPIDAQQKIAYPAAKLALRAVLEMYPYDWPPGSPKVYSETQIRSLLESLEK